jgi:YggT family protein
MFIFSNLFMSIANLLDIVITVYIWIVIIRVIVSWFNVSPYNPYTQFLIKVTEPALYKIRRLLPDFGGLDLSPMVLILGLYFVQSFLVTTLKQLAHALQ